MTKDLTKLYETIEGMDTAMMTTRRHDGHLVSRAMANQKRAPGADLWFVTSEATDKVQEITSDPHVNVAYYKDRTREWISIAGIARLTRDRDIIRQLYATDWKAWFPDEGDPRHGTPEDPRIMAIGVDIHSAVFLEVNKPQPVVLFEIAKGWLTGKEPRLGEMHEVGAADSADKQLR
jgi:general stress protein 26